MSRRQWVSVAEHRELRTKQRLLGEELEQVKSELALERRRYEAAFGAAQGMRCGKTALTMDALNFMVSEFVAMLPGLDDNRATNGVARRMRAIVGMPVPRVLSPTLLSPMCCPLCQEGHSCPVHDNKPAVCQACMGHPLRHECPQCGRPGT